LSRAPAGIKISFLRIFLLHLIKTRVQERGDYRYLIFIQSKNRTRPKVMIFAAMIGKELIQIPYAVHRSIPPAKSRSIASEKSLVSLSFQVRIT
jgi:hypothetical protein